MFFVRLLVLAISCVVCTQLAHADGLTYDHVLQGAVAKSYDLKLAKTDRKIAQNDIKQAFASYLPTSRLNGNYEYQHGFVGSAVPVAAVNNVILPTGTRFQNAMTFNTTYTLWDFGNRKYTLRAAKLHADATGHQTVKEERDVKLRVTDDYCDALTNWKALKTKQRVLTLYQELYDAKKRLFEAGSVSKVDVMEQAIKVAQTLDDINVCKQKLAADLHDLSEYTHENYDPDNIALEDFADEPIRFRRFVPEQTPEFKYFDLEVARKRGEIKALNAQRLPQISAYSNYIFYGSNKGNPGRAISDFSQRTFSVGVSMNWTLFDGFKNEADRERLELDIQRLKTEQEQKVWALKKQADKMVVDADLYRVQMATKAEIVSQRDTKSGAYKRLVDRKVSDKTNWLSEQAQLAEHQLDLDKADTLKRAAQMKLNIVAACM